MLSRIRSGSANAEEIFAWVQSRYSLADYLAKKEILVLSKAADREARRRWMLRVLAIDGYGDYYGPSKQGLIEAWRWLCLELRPAGLASPQSAELIGALEKLFNAHLRSIQDATWIEILGASVVDDWVVLNDWTMAGRLSVTNASTFFCRNGCRPLSAREFSVNTLEALDTKLSLSDDTGLAQALQFIEARIELELNTLNLVQAYALDGQV